MTIVSLDDEEMNRLIEQVEKCRQERFSIEITCEKEENHITFEDLGGDNILYALDNGKWNLKTYTGELPAIIQLIWERFCYREACLSSKRIKKLKSKP